MRCDSPLELVSTASTNCAGYPCGDHAGDVFVSTPSFSSSSNVYMSFSQDIAFVSVQAFDMTGSGSVPVQFTTAGDAGATTTDTLSCSGQFGCGTFEYYTLHGEDIDTTGDTRTTARLVNSLSTDTQLYVDNIRVCMLQETAPRNLVATAAVTPTGDTWDDAQLTQDTGDNTVFLDNLRICRLSESANPNPTSGITASPAFHDFGLQPVNRTRCTARSPSRTRATRRRTRPTSA